MDILGKDFYGNEFKWFVGIVEDRDDPTKSGNIRVRIIGVHSLNKAEVPTETLPWAQVITDSTGFANYVIGDWVMGFFQDGKNAQMPVVIGVYNGIQNETTYTYDVSEIDLTTTQTEPLQNQPEEISQNEISEDFLNSTVVSGNTKTSISSQGNTTVAVTETPDKKVTVTASVADETSPIIIRISEEFTPAQNVALVDITTVPVETVDLTRKLPRPPDGINFRNNGEPINSRLTRNQVSKTLIQRLNESVVAACDITVEVNAAVGWMKLKFGAIVQAIRRAIVSFINSLGFEPSGIMSLVISILKKVQAVIQFISDVIEEINEWIELFVDLARLINAIVHYILSLPARLIALVRNCLALLIRGVMAFIDGVFSLGDVPGIGLDLSPELLGAIGGVVDSTGNLVNSIGGVARNVNNVFGALTETPSEQSLLVIENAVFDTMENFVPISTDEFVENNTYTGNNKTP